MFTPCFTITYGHNCHKCVTPLNFEDHICVVCKSCINIVHFLTNFTSSASQKYECVCSREIIRTHRVWNGVSSGISTIRTSPNIALLNSECELTKDEERQILPDIICFYNHLVSLVYSEEDNSEQNCSRPKKLSQSHKRNYLKFTIGQTEYKVRESFLDVLKSQLIDSSGQDDILIDPQTGKLQLHKKEQEETKELIEKEIEKQLYSRMVQDEPPWKPQQFTQQAVPRKGTLKYKRWREHKLEQCNENYEDDLFDSVKFNDSVNLFEPEPIACDMYRNAPTPDINFALSPRESSDTSNFEDCFSLTELKINRKHAEEFQFQMYHKKRKLSPKEEDISSDLCCSNTHAHQRSNKILKELHDREKSDDDEESDFSDSQNK